MLAKAAAGRTKQATLALHLWCQSAASVMALLGFYAIYKNKKNNNAPHFTSTVPAPGPSRLPASGSDRAARVRAAAREARRADRVRHCGRLYRRAVLLLRDQGLAPGHVGVRPHRLAAAPQRRQAGVLCGDGVRVPRHPAVQQGETGATIRVALRATAGPDRCDGCRAQWNASQLSWGWVAGVLVGACMVAARPSASAALAAKLAAMQSP